MATPVFQVQTPTVTVFPLSPGSVLILTKDSTGTPVNVSSGYSLAFAYLFPQADANIDVPGNDMSGVGTWSFGATGVTWSWGSAVPPAPWTIHSNLYVGITNDSGATQAYLAQGTLTFQSNNGQG